MVGNQLLTFNFGAQVQTVATDTGGNASATFNIQEVPNTYPLIVDFAETTTCLGSSGVSSPGATVVKEPTRIAFGNTPYIALLTDNTGLPMRERFVYFTFNGTSSGGAAVNATRAAETDANGMAQLRGMTVPAGTYTVTVSFPGSIPTTSGTINMNNIYYLSSQAQTQVTADRTAPSCALTSVNYNGSGVATSIAVTVQDAGSGLSSVNPSALTNGTFSAPSYVAGQTSPLVVTVNKTDLSRGTSVTLHVVDVAGNVTNCDPEVIQVGRTSTLPRRARATVASTESTATIYNGTPGVQALQIKINNKSTVVENLMPGEVRVVDLSDLMKGRKDEDRVTVTADGPRGGTAVIIFSDASTGTP